MVTTASPTPTDAPPLSLPAGGLDPDRFDVKEAWYPVHYLEHLDPSQPTPFTLLGENIVIWFDSVDRRWRVFVDRCPHRFAPLSEGRINEQGQLECPYHGWSFKGSGECDRIPQQLEGGIAEQSARACAKSMPTQVCQGLLFVYPGQPENAERVAVPAIAPLGSAEEGWICLNTFRDLPYDALTLLENVLDASHVPYTHHRTVGNRANAAPVELELIEANKQGFEGLWQEGPRRGQLGAQTTIFIAPNLMWHDLTSKQFGRTLTVVYATPMERGKCRLFARFPFKFASPIPKFLIQLTPQWYSHINQNAILEDDQIFLYWQERYLDRLGGSEKYAQACYLPTKADRYVLAYRQWLDRYQADPFPHANFPPPHLREVLLDRYHSHTIHCRSCSTALKNIQRLRLGMGVMLAIAWLGYPFSLALLSVYWGIGWGVGLAIAAGFWFYLSIFEQKFTVGRSIPPRNLPEKKRK